MDAGPIVDQKTCNIDVNEKASTVLPYLFDVGTKSLLDAIPDVLSGKISMNSAMVQNEDGVVNAPMIDSAEGEIRVWEESATAAHNKCRGFSIWPGTFMYFQVGDIKEAEPMKVKVVSTRVLPETKDPTDSIELGPGKKDGLRIVCGDGSILEILEIQPVTRKVMDAKSFVNGLRGEKIKWVKFPRN
mmetsp:Transcript_5530/g.8044  ORF Transcript_5530/g.8044 Transcript_5530/m.8044 type:complete len:187 (-) Transcript_5530:187-747(-)